MKNIAHLFAVLDQISRREKTVARIAEILDMNPRTVYRHIYKLQELGFDISARRDGCYRFRHTGAAIPDFLKAIINHHSNDHDQRN